MVSPTYVLHPDCTNTLGNVLDGEHEAKLFKINGTWLSQIGAWEVRIKMAEQLDRTDTQKYHHQSEGKYADDTSQVSLEVWLILEGKFDLLSIKVNIFWEVSATARLSTLAVLFLHRKFEF